MTNHDGGSPGLRRGRARWITAMIAVVALAGCGSGQAATTGSSGASSAGSSSSGSGGGGTGGSGGGGTGQLSGTVAGHTLGSVSAAYLIGQSDDPAHTTVIYMFDTAVACADIGAVGWDKKVTDKTGALEMKLIGKMPAKYPIATGPNPAQGEAVVNFTETSKTATPQEETSTSGHVQLDTLVDAKSATGTLDLVFAQGSLKGSFSANWCPGGHEP